LVLVEPFVDNSVSDSDNSVEENHDKNEKPTHIKGNGANVLISVYK
jgi:hypothetical protein